MGWLAWYQDNVIMGYQVKLSAGSMVSQYYKVIMSVHCHKLLYDHPDIILNMARM